jgi:hypothetical protein
MKEERSRLNPGDQVYLRTNIKASEVYVENLDDINIDHIILVDKGTIGTVIAFEEERQSDYTYAGFGINELYVYESDWEKGIEDGMLCLIYWWTYEKGEDVPKNNVYLVPRSSLVKFDFLDQETVFALDEILVIFAEGDNALAQPAWGQKAIVVRFVLEDRNAEDIGVASSLQIWLTYVDPGGTSREMIRVEPHRVDLSLRDLKWRVRIFSSRAVFYVPGNTGNYRFHLELPGVGAVEKSFELPNLQPGDKVYIKQDAVRVDDGNYDRRMAEGSTGMIATFSQFQKSASTRFGRWKIENDDWYPVRAEHVNRFSDERPVQSGEIVLIEAEYLEKID